METYIKQLIEDLEAETYEPDERVLEKAESLTIISVGQRPTDYNENKLISPERAKSQQQQHHHHATIIIKSLCTYHIQHQKPLSIY